MASQWIDSENTKNSFSPVQAELLEVLLQSEDDTYPWNPSEANSEVYFDRQEGQFKLDDWSDEEIAGRSHSFFASLNSCWESESPASETLMHSLKEKFAVRIPGEWLEAIAQRATQVASANLSMADKLVECVEQMLPNWAAEDLLVLARPLAYAMRGDMETKDSALSVVRPAEWTDLSEMERIRLSLAIARYAVAHLHES